MKDQYERNIDYLRISVTDRCNLRCAYCMPDGIETMEMSEILKYEEILRIVKAAAANGIRIIKITGGEPLVRKGVIRLIEQIKNTDGIEKVTITTNGILLKENMKALVDAGIDGINISLDTLNPELFAKITKLGSLETVLAAIREALKHDIPVKINAVSFDLREYGKQFGIEVPEKYWKELIELTKDQKLDVRFIEVMPVGFGQAFKTLNHQDLMKEIEEEYPAVEKDETVHGYGPAVYYRIPGYQGSIGFISAIHGKFCSSCNRIRLTSDGYLKLCLCYSDGTDLKTLLRNGITDDELKEVFASAVYRKPEAHSFENKSRISEKKTMSRIGG